MPFRITTYGDGINTITNIVKNLNTGVETTYTNTLTFTPNATTQEVLGFARTSNEVMFRNFKLWTDIGRKNIFMHIPMQDGGNAAKDVIGGLQGTASNVKIVDV